MALFVEVFRMFRDSGELLARQAGNWARESFHSISFVLTRLLVYSAVLVLAAVLLSSMTGWWWPLLTASVLLMPFLAFVATGYRTLNAAAISLLADLALAKLAGKIQFHRPWHVRGAVEYTGTNIGEELHILAFFAKTVLWTVIMEYMIILFCLAIPVGYVPALPFILFTGLITWVLVRTVWGQQTGIPEALVVTLTIIASLAYTVPMLNNIGSVRRITTTVNNWDEAQQQRANAGALRGMEAAAVLAEINTRIVDLQAKMMRNNITVEEKAELNGLIKHRNLVESLAAGTYDGQTNSNDTNAEGAEEDEPHSGSILPGWQFPTTFNINLDEKNAPGLIVIVFSLLLAVGGIWMMIKSFVPVRRLADETDAQFKARQEARRSELGMGFTALVFSGLVLILGTMFVNSLLSRLPDQRSVHDINREILEERRANVRSEPAAAPVVQDVVYEVPRQYNCSDAQHLTLDQPWHYTGFSLKPGGSLKVTITSHEVRTDGGPSCPMTGCSPTPASLEGMRTTHHPHMALLGQVGNNPMFAIIKPTFVIPASVVGTGQLKLSHNLRTVQPNGAPATHDWANLEGQVCYQVEVL